MIFHLLTCENKLIWEVHKTEKLLHCWEESCCWKQKLCCKLYHKVDNDVLFSSGDIMQTLMGEGNSGTSASNTTIESEEVD